MGNNWELDYVNLIKDILKNGELKSSRAGGVYTVFARTLTVDNLEWEFPILQGRKMFFRQILGEFAALIRGPKNISDFKKYGCNYWDKWAGENGDINIDYGNIWNNFGGVNQMQKLVETLHNNPNDRRMIISGWKPDNLNNLNLPCCHLLYQWFVRQNKYLDMIWYQRSVDTMIGLPSDIVLAAIWNILLAYQTGYLPGKVTMFLADTHIYTNHLEQTQSYIENTERLFSDNAPEPISYKLSPKATVFNFEPEMIQIDYKQLAPPIKFELNG